MLLLEHQRASRFAQYRRFAVLLQMSRVREASAAPGGGGGGGSGSGGSVSGGSEKHEVREPEAGTRRTIVVDGSRGDSAGAADDTTAHQHTKRGLDQGRLEGFSQAAAGMTREGGSAEGGRPAEVGASICQKVGCVVFSFFSSSARMGRSCVFV